MEGTRLFRASKLLHEDTAYGLRRILLRTKVRKAYIGRVPLKGKAVAVVIRGHARLTARPRIVMFTPVLKAEAFAWLSRAEANAKVSK